METPRLTIPEGTFIFERSRDRTILGHGNWYVVRATDRNLKPGTMVHSAMSQDLSNLARARNIPEPYNYARVPPKPEKTKAVRIPRSAGPKLAPGLMGGFNPMAKFAKVQAEPTE